jgi:hypothetical protein
MYPKRRALIVTIELEANTVKATIGLNIGQNFMSAPFQPPFTPDELAWLLAASKIGYKNRSLGKGAIRQPPRSIRARTRRSHTTNTRSRSMRPIASSTPVAPIIKQAGEKLFATLFPGHIIGHIKERLAEKRKTHLDIRLNISQAYKHYPWEIMHGELIEGLKGYLAVAKNITLVRTPGWSNESVRPGVRTKIHLLIVSTNAEDLKSEKEVTAITQALQPLIKWRRVKLHCLSAPSHEQLFDYIQKQRIHILHVIGHGSSADATQQAFIQLTKDDEGMGADRVRHAIHNTHLRLVWFNTCSGAVQSETQESMALGAYNSGVPAIIANQAPIEDAAACELAEAFYTALARKEPIHEALQQARSTLWLQHSDASFQWAMPVLFLRYPDAQLFMFRLWHFFGLCGSALVLILLTIKLCQPNPPDPKKIRLWNNTGQLTIKGLTADGDTLWIGAMDDKGVHGLYRLDTRNTKNDLVLERTYETEILDLAVDCKGNVWIVLDSPLENPQGTRVYHPAADKTPAREITLDLSTTHGWITKNGNTAIALTCQDVELISTTDARCKQDSVKVWFGNNDGHLYTLCYKGDFPTPQNRYLVPPGSDDSHNQLGNVMQIDDLFYDSHHDILWVSDHSESVHTIPFNSLSDAQHHRWEDQIAEFAKGDDGVVWGVLNKSLLRFPNGSAGDAEMFSFPATSPVILASQRTIISRGAFLWIGQQCGTSRSCAPLTILYENGDIAAKIENSIFTGAKALTLDYQSHVWIGTDKGLLWYGE